MAHKVNVAGKLKRGDGESWHVNIKVVALGTRFDLIMDLVDGSSVSGFPAVLSLDKKEMVKLLAALHGTEADLAEWTEKFLQNRK